jgi:ribosomal protein S18 acetylase RimI-like enzyme
MTIQLLTPNHATALAALIGSIARERRWFFATQAISVDGLLENLILMEALGIPDFGAFEDDGKLVGWATIRPERNQYEGFQHCGKLSMGVRKGYRDRGYGRALLNHVLANTRFSRVELEVFGTNYNAIGLYESVGFVREGCKVGARVLDGLPQDIVLMARISAPAVSTTIAP